MPAPKTYAKASILQAILDQDGNLSAAARQLGCTRRTLYQRAKKDKEIMQTIEDAREGMLDDAESALYRAVRKGEAWAVCFFLKTQGKKRGYSEKHEVIQEVRQAPQLDTSKLDDTELEQLDRLLAKASQGREVPT